MTSSYVTPMAATNDITVSPNKPTTPSKGNLWVDTTGFFMYVYDGARWIGLTDDGNLNKIAFIQDEAPQPSVSDSIIPGTLWFDTDKLDLKIYYVDNDSAQWISCTNNGLIYKGADEEIARLKLQQEALEAELESLEKIIKDYTLI